MGSIKPKTQQKERNKKLTKKAVSVKYWILIAGFAAAVVMSVVLLEGDAAPFWKWALAAAAAGLAFYPLSRRLFSAFKDGGWLFSKALGIALAGFVCWAFVSAGAFKFDNHSVYGCTAVLAAAVWAVFVIAGKKAVLKEREKEDIFLILFEELLFLAVFLTWTYIAGFRPEAIGTEKFMDYGYMATLYRDGGLPAVDMWFGPEKLNYYYGGQYYAVFLTRLSGTTINTGYNLARTLVAAFTFCMPFSILWNLFSRLGHGRNVTYPAGLFAGASVGLAGNMHYVIYGLLGKVLKPSGYETYWFPSSTRYIGHNPLTNDQCIHEFPSYSFVLGDLHAHMVNLLFVLCLLGLLAAFVLAKEEEKPDMESPVYVRLMRCLLEPHVWLFGFFAGLFRFTNYWDYVIYLTVIVLGLALLAIRHGRGRALENLAGFVIRTAWVYLVSCLAALPFTLHFKTMMSGFGKVVNRTPLYQLAVLWALPAVSVVLLFVFTVVRSHAVKYEKASVGKYIRHLAPADMIMLLFGFCAIGLILIPELIYVRDIYEAGYARSNTMFKLTYQAYVMFGMSMIYAVFRLIMAAKKKAVMALGTVILILFILTLGYFPYSVKCWAGNVTDKAGFRGLDAEAFLETTYPDDAAAIRWLEENVKGSPMVLEANGDSYSKNCRVSAMTGLPTVLGWYVHEWLWRSDVDAVRERAEDVKTIYTSTDENEVRRLLKKYSVEYIFVGSCERQTFPDINEELLKSLGFTVFSGSQTSEGTYILETAHY